MIKRPTGVGAFQFVVLAGLRAAQLTRGCTPRVDGTQKLIVTAQREVAEGKVLQLFDAAADDVPPIDDAVVTV
jgi:hypothetical protein